MINLAQYYNLRPADVIKAKKIGWNILDHYITYLGDQNGNSWFIANDINYGVRLFNNYEAYQLLRSFEPISIRKFTGNEWERNEAVERALSQEGRSYNLITFNCEHLANYIQYGDSQSRQVAKGAGILGLALVLIGLSSSGK